MFDLQQCGVWILYINWCQCYLPHWVFSVSTELHSCLSMGLTFRPHSSVHILFHSVPFSECVDEKGPKQQVCLFAGLKGTNWAVCVLCTLQARLTFYRTLAGNSSAQPPLSPDRQSMARHVPFWYDLVLDKCQEFCSSLADITVLLSLDTFLLCPLDYHQPTLAPAGIARIF